MKTTKLPTTDSIQELARFWDTHDLTDFEDDLVEVSAPVFEREQPKTPSLKPVLVELAATMRTVGGFIGVMGALFVILGCIGLIQQLSQAVPASAIVSTNLLLIAYGLATALIGSWTISASAAFRQSTEPGGNDLASLMPALAHLVRVYHVQYLIWAGMAVVMTGIVGLALLTWRIHSV